ncbi:hypothetical protein C8J56DRAFT_1168709 [Mycena floridula]|nr:hypothetical protein C8J56DRAFT_1168709 [Mycena floridula]
MAAAAEPVGRVVHLLGLALKENLKMRYAFTKLYGISDSTSKRLCARFQLHDRAKVKDLTPLQVTAIASFLSAPETATRLPRMPLAPPGFTPDLAQRSLLALQNEFKASQQAAQRQRETKIEAMKADPRLTWKYKHLLRPVDERDPLHNLKTETVLRREIRENIGHQKMIGSYVGRRHTLGLPVRGQTTQNNAKTARKHNPGRHR